MITSLWTENRKQMALFGDLEGLKVLEYITKDQFITDILSGTPVALIPHHGAATNGHPYTSFYSLLNANDLIVSAAMSSGGYKPKMDTLTAVCREPYEVQNVPNLDGLASPLALGWAQERPGGLWHQKQLLQSPSDVRIHQTTQASFFQPEPNSKWGVANYRLNMVNIDLYKNQNPQVSRSIIRNGIRLIPKWRF